MATVAAARMKDLAVSPKPQSHAMPLYLLFAISDIADHRKLRHPLRNDDGFEFAAARAKSGGGGGDVALQACASDVPATFGGEQHRLRLPPRLQRPVCSAGASPSTSTSPPSPADNRCNHTGFDPFAAALEKVRRGAGATMRRSDRSSLSDDAVATRHRCDWWLSPPRFDAAGATMPSRRDWSSWPPRSDDAAAPRWDPRAAALPSICWRARPPRRGRRVGRREASSSCCAEPCGRVGRRRTACLAGRIFWFVLRRCPSLTRHSLGRCSNGTEAG
ncbi:hypothetical protein ACP70R_046094 [Stipagrostis hirtigluma subsp. patula]